MVRGQLNSLQRPPGKPSILLCSLPTSSSSHSRSIQTNVLGEPPVPLQTTGTVCYMVDVCGVCVVSQTLTWFFPRLSFLPFSPRKKHHRSIDFSCSVVLLLASPDQECPEFFPPALIDRTLQSIPWPLVTGTHPPLYPSPTLFVPPLTTNPNQAQEPEPIQPGPTCTRTPERDIKPRSIA